MALEPTNAEVLRRVQEAYLLDVHTALPGKVIKYYPATQTADVQPMVMRTVVKRDGSKVNEALPVVPNVPIGWTRAGGYWITMPLAKDDPVFLIFSEAAMAQYRESADLSEPGDIRRHDLSYPIALPMGIAAPHALDPSDVDGGLVIDGDGPIRIGAAPAPPAARQGDTIEGVIPPGVLVGTIVYLGTPSPITGVITWTPPQFVGTITTGSPKVGIGS